MNEIERELKKYKLDVLLMLLANQSKELFSNHIPFKSVEWKRPIGGFLQTFTQILPAWDLADLSFLAIRSSNDYRSIVPTNDTVFRLNNLLIKTGDEEAKERNESISKEEYEGAFIIRAVSKAILVSRNYQGR